ncbi:MAG: S8 family peptidase [Salinivirgaceae bacterium]|jgi:subtilisin family serine protease|nr:S8 family peptidase [Salinivirgaceae bacterium]
MKKLVLAILLLSNLSAISQVSAYLNRKINQQGDEPVAVIVILKQQWNTDSAITAMKVQKLTADKRLKTTISEVRKFTTKHQKALLQTVTHMRNQNTITNIQPFWAANIVAMEADAEAIFQLAQHPDVDQIVYDEPAYAIYPQPGTESGDIAKEDGVLQGIETINAPALWRLGYTGKGRLAFGVDTGIFPDHPAFGNRFLGNYLPLSQCWFGYNNSWPFDITDHGTHTMGTILGFKSEMNDTIGVAFNARFIASDPIVGNLSELRTRSELMESFQWALNPDGDATTVSDVPDVINNSWGLSNSDNPDNCDLPSTLVLNTVNTAGIAVVFSAGNDGPGAGTVGEPAHIARSTTNVFSVGALSASNLSIAGFSSRGPTNCYSGTDTSLRIKPEVSAPGVSVYSAEGASGWGYMSGTSMAAPHVAGAVLLLKEAFPQVAGDEILLALYNTAIDLGEAGEDNVFGNGLIDVEAAYYYLADTHTPVPPETSNDNVYTNVFRHDYFGPQSSYQIGVDLYSQNGTDFSITDILLFDGEQPVPVTITTIDSTTFTRLLITIDAASLNEATQPHHILKGRVQTDIANEDTTDNQFWIRIFHPETENMPFTETFESGIHDFSGSKVVAENPDNLIGWRLDTISGFSNNRYAARMLFIKYNRRETERDYLHLPPVTIDESENPKLSFSYAYAKRAYSVFKDSLLVRAHYGENYENTDTLYLNYGADMATLDANQGVSIFVPWSHQQWKDTTISLAHLQEYGTVKITFTAINDNGNNLFIDNIAIHENDSPLADKNMQNKHSRVTIYPNPVSHELQIGNLSNQSTIRLTDFSGRMIWEKQTRQQRETINMVNYKPGVYLIQIIGQGQITTKKIIKH